MIRPNVQSISSVLVFAACVVVYLVVDLSIYRSLVLLGAISLVHLFLVKLQWSRWLLLAAFLPLAFAAISQVPNGTDLWIYHSYGRIVVEHGDNPYVAVPDDYANDVVMQRVLPMYRSEPSIYGPVFVLGAGGIAAVFGDSETGGRLAWQIISCVAVLGSAYLLRKRVTLQSLSLLLLSPITLYLVIHQAHNDVFVGLAILGACILANKNRYIAASICFSFAALMKIPSGISLLVLVLWLLMNHQFRKGLKVFLTAIVSAGIFLIPFGGRTPVAAMLSSNNQVNATSIWNSVRGDWESFVFRPLREANEKAGHLVSFVSIVLVLFLAIIATWKLRRQPIHFSVSVALLGYIILALHPSAWYYAWVLPLACLWGKREQVLIFGLSSLYFLTTQAWLLPVAAQLTGDGRLQVIDRLGAPLLGVVSLAGMLIILRLIDASAKTNQGSTLLRVSQDTVT
ncbi:MAG: hypothetical protein F2780_02250 [Actinobacteria bacterium]|nr:hypothetical protein [Actinomycetota bacterium]MSX35980.1 hypothetical protein [Actinomycetota bacterium]MSZ71735.1 hypothetical protein [Actinomycetota bacterium]MUH57034.1 hypothetical protein [Actinomycetota bacterium]